MYPWRGVGGFFWCLEICKNALLWIFIKSIKAKTKNRVNETECFTFTPYQEKEKMAYKEITKNRLGFDLERSKNLKIQNFRLTNMNLSKLKK